MPNVTPKATKAKLEEDLKMSMEAIAAAIEKIASGMDVLRSSRLKPATVVMLVSKASAVPKEHVEKVLKALPDLALIYLK